MSWAAAIWETGPTFCGNTEIPSDLQEREPQRVELYKATVALVCAYANIADELETAGYDAAGIGRIKQELKRYVELRDIIRNASGEKLDLKAYEADMRHLIDTYIEADEARKISPFDGMGLLDLIVKTGIADAIASPRFVALMDQFIPKWQFLRQRLNRLPVRHADWGY